MAKIEKYKYVDENGTVWDGGVEAERLVKLHGDKQYLNKYGVSNVSRERWNTAQSYERSEWMERGTFLSDDRNLFHKEVFDGYDSLTDVDAKSFIELGCGPFTNARVILEKFPNIEQITLLDPLANDYLNHANCTYKKSRLNVGRSEIDVNLIASSIEDSNIKDTFDVVVMINVLEHCFDIPKIFDVVDEILNKDGIFIYADVQFDIETIQKITEFKYNAGHPIRLTEEYIGNILDTKYTQLFSKTSYEEVAGMDAEERYFIGRKR
tara:strand:- start:3027 stop:3824 length:798 start_codon:yes stop_codon:yes gene_type:complete